MAEQGMGMQQQQQQGMGGMREYRKGNWTLQETMILIEAKKMDDERRKLTKEAAYQQSPTTTMTSSSSGSSSVIVKPVTELRWKWVEEYCWRKGCLRSQNQCNDKWDNLMRDYKKVREYQKSLTSSSDNNINNKSYWEMDKVERKDKSLPTNMLPQIYQALFDIVETSAATTGTTTAAAVAVSGPVPGSATQFLLPSPPVRRQSPPPTTGVALQLPPPPPSRLQTPPYHQLPYLLPVTPTALELSEASVHSQPESPAKRRRKDEGAPPTPGEAGTSTGAAAAHQVAAAAATSTPPTTISTPPESLQEVSSAICRSASMIADAIRTNEEKEERRHREMIHIHETRLRLEESKLEVTRQGFNGLTEAINKLANSILTWANNNNSNRTRQPGP